VPAADPAARPWGSWWWLILWGLLVALALALRPLLPVDETRYLSVAWEMWQRDDWLVPYLNGAPYSDKPPLLFWSMLLGWRIFGVNEWWPRLLSPLFGLAVVFLLMRLARRLSPGELAQANTPLTFLSGPLWVAYSTVVLFDTLLAACVLVALLGVVDAWQGRPGRGWLIYGLAIGLGVLAKGPVVLVHVLPCALLAPWWATTSRPGGWDRWYLGVALGLALGAALGLAWAIPAGVRGGPDYQRAILWEQSAGRVATAFAHERPWWWYLPLLPLVLFPWSLWPPLWRGLAGLRRESTEIAPRFALACIMPAVIVLSLISGKQVHYLMPLLPVFAILAAAASRGTVEQARSWDTAAAAMLLASGGGLLLASPLLQRETGAESWLPQIPRIWGLVLVVGALLLALPRPPSRQMVALSLVSPALLIVMHLAGTGLIRRIYDLRPAALLLKRAEEAGRPVAFVGKYQGQFHFLGHLERPFEPVTRDSVPEWMANHPDGLVIRQQSSRTFSTTPLFVQPYRDGVMGIWEATPADKSPTVTK
jgi:4-amino-4-deoxy-L-arabinose transferase-like glycosyltransferase